MNDNELRALVRDVIARRLGAPAATPTAAPNPNPGMRVHASHGLLDLPRGGNPDGSCIIEPELPCTHCGYCRSHGH